MTAPAVDSKKVPKTHVEYADSNFKGSNVDSIQIWHGGYSGILYYTVAVILDKNVYHVGIARTNLNHDQFSRPKGRKIAVGRALYQAAVFRGPARRRAKFAADPDGNFKREKDGKFAPINAITIPVGYQEPKQTEDLATIATNLLSEGIPEFLFRQHLPKEKKDEPGHDQPQG